MQPLVPHNLPSLYPPSFDFLYLYVFVYSLCAPVFVSREDFSTSYQGGRQRGASTGVNTSTGSEISLIYLLQRPKLSPNSA